MIKIHYNHNDQTVESIVIATAHFEGHVPYGDLSDAITLKTYKEANSHGLLLLSCGVPNYQDNNFDEDIARLKDMEELREELSNAGHKFQVIREEAADEPIISLYLVENFELVMTKTIKLVEDKKESD